MVAHTRLDLLVENLILGQHGHEQVEADFILTGGLQGLRLRPPR